jgi:hypothetical protein
VEHLLEEARKEIESVLGGAEPCTLASRVRYNELLGDLPRERLNRGSYIDVELLPLFDKGVSIALGSVIVAGT